MPTTPKGTLTKKMSRQPPTAGAALVPEAMARIAEKLGAIVAPTSPPTCRDLVLVHRLGPLSPAASRFVDLAVGDRDTDRPGDDAEAAVPVRGI
jgi:hypothetical protein